MEQETRTGTGVCRFCGQVKMVRYVNENMTQEDIDDIATRECDCDGALLENQIQYSIDKGVKSVKRVIEKRNPAVADLLRPAVEMIVRGCIRKITVSIDGASSASLFQNKDRVVAEFKKTETYQADGTEIADMPEED